MKYEKKTLTFEEQAGQLLARGLIAEKDVLIQRLESVSYYRLSGYWYPLRKPDSEDFREGVTLDMVWMRYCFDRRLRSLLLDAIERIEVSLRTKLIYNFSHKYGAFGYQDANNLPALKIKDYLEWRAALLEETARSKEAFKKKFFEKYKDAHQELPVWMLAELMSFGSLLTFYKGLDSSLKQKIAAEYGLHDELLLSWLGSLNAARNICAHHARLWNKVLGYAPGFPSEKNFPAWHIEPKLHGDRVGILLFICRFFLYQVAPTSQWHRRVEGLFAEFPLIPVRETGLPEKRESHPAWNTPVTQSNLSNLRT